MSAVIAVTDPWAALSAISVFLTALSGYFVWRAGIKASEVKHDSDEARRSADLVRAEHEGWQVLLDNLRVQYDNVVKERQEILTALANTRQELFQTRNELMATRQELSSMRARVLELERLLQAK